ncbi:hypothetical protein P3T76_001476 [Phytophthora citrophthora]|uniref:SAM domain-containing protein n=1 Tax=Phytophthora citrophthora TaxID=4793 RepID=A0AAD9LSW6_9STRA|nr:hypothetical protein P3T76_001476 [Phytophthora citrophthora]
MTTELNTVSSAIVFPPCASFEQPYDLDIVRKIVEREGCLEALQQLLGTAKKPQQPRISGISKAPMVFQSVIDQIRSSSVQIVEDIERWQQEQKVKAQATNFKWRGVNYLLKMTSDLDFLQSFRGVDLLESLQVLRLMQNPFLAQIHLDHPALREEDQEYAVRLFGNWVGDISMRRVFPALKVLLRERDAETRNRQLRMGQAPGQAIKSIGADGGPVAAVVPLESLQPQTTDIGLVVNGGDDGATLTIVPAASNSREAAMREDIALSRELITQAEHELGAMRNELAALQIRLNNVILPDKRRRLQIRIGCLVNDLKFRSGDLYQRKNKLKRKESIYRATKDRRGSGGRSRGTTRSHSQPLVVSEVTHREGKGGIYSSLFEKALLEDEQIRNDLVLRVNASLSKAKVDEHKRTVGLCTPNRQLQKSTDELQNQLEIREDIERWGVREVQNFIDSLGLDNGSYGSNFRAQGIDGVLLVQATGRDLEELGVGIRLHRVRILAECNMRRDQ